MPFEFFYQATLNDLIKFKVQLNFLSLAIQIKKENNNYNIKDYIKLPKNDLYLVYKQINILENQKPQRNMLIFETNQRYEVQQDYEYT